MPINGQPFKVIMATVFDDPNQAGIQPYRPPLPKYMLALAHNDLPSIPAAYTAGTYPIQFVNGRWETENQLDITTQDAINAKASYDAKLPLWSVQGAVTELIAIDIECWMFPPFTFGADLQYTIDNIVDAAQKLQATLQQPLTFYNLGPASGLVATKQYTAQNDTLAPLRGANDLLIPQINPHIAAWTPKAYAVYDSADQTTSDAEWQWWKDWISFQVSEARRLSPNTPIYPYLWWEYDPVGDQGTGTAIPINRWREMLDHCLSVADGVTIWGGGAAEWSDSMPWWVELQSFMSDNGIDQPKESKVPSFTADTATLNAVISAADNPAKRAAVNAGLGEGTLTFELVALNSIITGTFSGSVWGDAVLAVDNVQLASVGGPGGAVADATRLTVTNASGRFVRFPPGAYSFVGAGGSDNVQPGNEIRVTFRYEPDPVTPPADDLYIPVAELIAGMEEASTLQPAFGQHTNNEAVMRSPTYDAVVGYLGAAPAGQDDFDDFVEEIYPWPWAYPATGHNVGIGLRLEMRRLKVSACRKSTGQWQDLPESGLGPNLGWNGNTQTGPSTKLRNEAGTGNLSFGPTTINEGVEVWPPVETYKDKALFRDTKAWGIVFQARVIDDNGDPYNGADGRFAVQLGFDQYGGRERGGDDKYAAPARYPRTRADGGNKRWDLVTGGDWTTIGLITMESFKFNENPHAGYVPPWPYDRSPYVLTRQQVLDNPPSWATGGGTSTTSSMFGGVVDADPNYVVRPRPANAVRDLMVATDPAWLCGEFATGWHQWLGVKQGGVTSTHMRLVDWRDNGNPDDGGMFVGSVVKSRHNYETARIARCAAQSNGCPKILPIWMFPKWMISAANIAEVQARGGQENQFGQIFNITRYPSFPYGAHPPETWEYIKEYVRAIYRPVSELGPNGEPGLGYTKDNWPVLELGNEQKFASRTIGASRAWFASSSAVNTRCFNLMTMREMNEGLRALKEVAPAGVLVAAGGYEGDFNGSVGKTLANPNAEYSYFQAQMLTDDNHGGLGIDHVDIVFAHPYMYAYNPERSQVEIDNCRAQIEWLAAHLGRPEIAAIPLHCNETGHESPSGVDNTYGTITYLINQQGAASAYATTARNMKRSVLIWVANGSKQNCLGGNHFVDRPYGNPRDSYGERQTYGAPSEVPELIAANQYGNQVVNKVVRQAYQLSDGQIVCYFEDGTTLQA